MPPVIEIDALVKRYGNLVAVDGVSLSVDRGEVVALLGPNGAGKTTTVDVVTSVRRRDAGDVRVLGLDPGIDWRELAPRIGVMPQSGELYAGIRATEAVRLFASFYDEPTDPDTLIERLGLGDVRRTTFRRLSGGEKRRLSLALALVGRPEVLVLDEPTGEMDVRGRADTWELLGELRERGTAVLLTTHILEEAERLADRVAIMHHGRLVAVGPPAQLAADEDVITFSTSEPVDIAALGDALGARVLETTGGYRVEGVRPAPGTVAVLAARLATAGVMLRSLEVGRRSLTEVYLSLTEGP